MLRRRGESNSDNNSNTRTSKRLRTNKENVEVEDDAWKNEYCGYMLKNNSDKDDTKYEPIDTLRSEVSPLEFFQKYIAKRNPVILDFHPCFPKGDALEKSDRHWKLSKSILQSVAGEEPVQVEKRRHIRESFGQQRTDARQVQMKIVDFLECLGNCSTDNAELYYLSTQQPEDADVSTPITGRRCHDHQDMCMYQTPCRQLVQESFIPSNLPIAGNMILHSCNLWMGASVKGSSSGLHHDFHDNFYILLNGTKRFRLYSPDSALYMYTKGTIHKVYSNGVISYVGSETRSDGTPLASSNAIATRNHSDAKYKEPRDTPIYDENRVSEEDDECVLGKGFDYESSEEEDTNLFPPDHDDDWDMEHDDYDLLERQEDQCDMDDEELEPPADSFSKIPPSVLNDKHTLTKDFPNVSTCSTCEIELRGGQALYLPTGWFHEVVSFSERNDPHSAVNYWFYPPATSANFDFPYESECKST